MGRETGNAGNSARARDSEGSCASRNERAEVLSTSTQRAISKKRYEFLNRDVQGSPLLHTETSTARTTSLLGRNERSSPEAAQRRAKARGLTAKLSAKRQWVRRIVISPHEQPSPCALAEAHSDHTPSVACQAVINRRLSSLPPSHIISGMNGLVINISWEYFLGIVGSLIAVAYYTNGRFTRLETNFDWLADALRDLTVKAENISAKAFEVGSPISLTLTGERLLQDSGLKSYIDRRRDELSARLQASAPFDLYAVQQSAFRLFDRVSFDESFARHLNKYAFRNGISTELLRRVGAIYLRDIAVSPR
jgi:hypothetical protein